MSSRTDGQVAVRDGKNTQQSELLYTAEEWIAFLRGVKAGEFDFGLITDQESHPAT